MTFFAMFPPNLWTTKEVRTKMLLQTENLAVRYVSGRGELTALCGVNIQVAPGGALGIVGESGSGKSTLALALTGLLPKSSIVTGHVTFESNELLGASPRSLNSIRGAGIGLVYQDALASLNPVRRVGDQIVEVVRRHRSELGRRGALERAIWSLDRVGIPSAKQRFRDYPHQFSGGMRQRVAIAMALAAEPRLLIADEVTTALDVTIKSQILELLGDLRRELNMGLIVISHDLDVVAGITDDLAVMYAGRIVETGRTADVLREPSHPYTSGLIVSAPTIDRPKIAFIPGAPPTGGVDHVGCAFAPRCPLRRGRELCVDAVPLLKPVVGGPIESLSACHYGQELFDSENKDPEPVSGGSLYDYGVRP